MSKFNTAKVSRRRLLFAGAGTAGAVAAAAMVAPVVVDTTAPATPEKKDAADQNGGYQVTAHVLRYYDTARV
jgi:Ubiquitinol-cytochrome C reductase Fe-S subunit TAT signal